MGLYRERRHQAGSALMICLIFMLLLTIIGIGAMQSATLQERMAGNSRDQNLAFQAAEAALRAGEQELQGSTIPVFNNSTPGLRQPVNNPGNAAFWAAYGWTGEAGANAGSQEYERDVEGVPQRPRYVIEELPAQAMPGGSLKLAPIDDAGFYRVTARSTGQTADAAVLLQTVYKR